MSVKYNTFNVTICQVIITGKTNLISKKGKAEYICSGMSDLWFKPSIFGVSNPFKCVADIN